MSPVDPETFRCTFYMVTWKSFLTAYPVESSDDDFEFLLLDSLDLELDLDVDLEVDSEVDLEVDDLVDETVLVASLFWDEDCATVPWLLFVVFVPVVLLFVIVPGLVVFVMFVAVFVVLLNSVGTVSA